MSVGSQTSGSKSTNWFLLHTPSAKWKRSRLFLHPLILIVLGPHFIVNGDQSFLEWALGCVLLLSAAVLAFDVAIFRVEYSDLGLRIPGVFRSLTGTGRFYFGMLIQVHFIAPTKNDRTLMLLDFRPEYAGFEKKLLFCFSHSYKSFFLETPLSEMLPAIHHLRSLAPSQIKITTTNDESFSREP